MPKNMFCNKYYTKCVLTMIILISSITTFAQNINVPIKGGPMGLNVNTSTGNLFLQRNDLIIPCRMAIEATFYYNGFGYSENTGYGNGWSFNYSTRYKKDTANGITI